MQWPAQGVVPLRYGHQAIFATIPALQAAARDGNEEERAMKAWANTLAVSLREPAAAFPLSHNLLSEIVGEKIWSSRTVN